MDRASYQMGKMVFSGEFTVSERPGEAAAQIRILRQLQAKLPLAARKRANLPAHPGKLSDEQLEALRYFLAKRYKVR